MKRDGINMNDFKCDHPSNEQELIKLLGTPHFPEIPPPGYVEAYGDKAWYDLVYLHTLAMDD